VETLLSFFTGSMTDSIWNYFFFPCIFLGGVYFTFRTGGVQIVRWKEILKNTVGSLFTRQKASGGSVTPFQAMTTALAATVGTGSIVGTCQALVFGGYGAVFWLWAASFLGMVIKFCEVVLSIHYRRRNREGEWVGGPMYYMRHGLGKMGKPLSVFFSFFALLGSFAMGNLVQTNSISLVVAHTASSFVPLSERGEKTVCLVAGLVVASLLALAIFGGMKRIGTVTGTLVPYMTLGFGVLCLLVIFARISNLPKAFFNIFVSAFSPRAVFGAAGGITTKLAFEWGIRRSAFSNEAGLGTAAIAHAGADTDHPVRQGFFGIFEVFVDTFLVSTMVALTVIVSLPPSQIHTSPADESLITSAFASLYGTSFASLFVGIALILFAFSTLLGWSLYGCRCAEYLFGSRIRSLYQILFCCMSAVGAILSLDTVWSLSDTFNALMSIPNFIALFSLSGVVKRLTKEFFQKKRSRNSKEKV